MRTKRTPSIPLFFAIILIVLLANLTYPVEGNQNSSLAAEPLANYETLMQNINMARIRETISYLSSIDSRIIGYDGYYNATEYVFNILNHEIGLENVTLLEYDVTAPLSYGASITIEKHDHSELTVPLHPLEPNQAHPCMTPPEGIQGKLIYAEDAGFEDIEGKEISGSVVILSFNCQYRWVRLAELGAKAFIFIEPDITTPFEVDSKSLDIPLNIPRFYATKEEASMLLENLGSKVRLESDVKYEVVKAYNIIGFLPGTDMSLEDEILAVSARYDSYSIVLDMAPGADMSSGISVLIELARFFKENPPKHPILFVAFSGTDMALAGARDFAERFVWGDYWDIYGKRIYLLVNLDLSVESPAVQGLAEGYFYKYRSFNGNWEWAQIMVFSKYLENIQNAWESLYGSSFPVHPFTVIEKPGITGAGLVEGDWPTLNPSPYWLDSEPYTAAGGTAISIYTPLVFRFRWRTPLDTYDRISEDKFENLRHQFEYLLCVFSSATDEEHYQPPVNLRDERESGRWTRMTTMYVTIVGQTVRYDITSGRYVPIPNVTVVLVRPEEIGDPTFDIGLYYRYNTMRIIAKSGNDGIFTIRGVLNRGTYSEGGYTMEAYRVDDDGSISYATDLGQYGAGAFSNSFVIQARGTYGTEVAPRYFIVFPCATINMFGVELPEIMRNPGLPDTHAQEAYYPTLEVVNARTNFVPDFYGFVIDFKADAAQAFIPQDVPIKVVVRNEWTTRVISILTNATEGNPEGEGYILKTGESYTISPTMLGFARDLFLLDESRVELLTEREIGVAQVISDLHAMADRSLTEAILAFSYGDYASAWTNAKKVMLYEYKIYPEVVGVLKDVVQTTVFFFILLIPFAFLGERFLIPQGGKGRLLAVIGIFVLGLLPLYLFHPGFLLASNISALLLGCLVFVMVIPMLAIVFSKISSILLELRRRFVRRYEQARTRISRFSILSLSVSVGIQNMRRRRLRSSMALISIVLATFAITLTSAFIPISTERVFPREGFVPYDGILIRQEDSRTPISEDVYNFVSSQLPSSALIVPRAAWYPPHLDYPPLWLRSDSGEDRVFGLWGTAYSEFELGMVKTSLIPGSRWIEDSDYLTCLIPSVAAEELNINIGNKVYLNDLELTVVGLFDDRKLDLLVDIDQESPAPRDFRGGGDVTLPIYGANLIIVPLRLALSLGGDIHGMSISFENTSQIRSFASSIADNFAELKIFVGFENQVYVSTAVSVVTLAGGASTYVPLIICGFLILNLMLGGVYERKNEIGIYSSVGLSPMNVIGLFLSESIVYGALSAILGYDLGILATVLTRSLGIVAESAFNLTSTMVIYAVLVLFVALLLASLYPINLASRLVTPSLERKWKMPSKPKGDLWNIPLPFTYKSEEESAGVLVFLKNFLRSHTSEELGNFVARNVRLTSEEVDGKEAYRVKGDFRLAPYPSNIEQHVECIVTEFSPERWVFNVNVTRTSGGPKLWKKVNYTFVDEIRKRMMAWTSLNPEEKGEFLLEGKKKQRI